MNIIYPNLAKNQYSLKCSYQTASKNVPESATQNSVDNVDLKLNNNCFRSYVNVCISMKGNNKDFNNINNYYDLNKWYFLTEIFTTKHKEVEPLTIDSKDDYMTLINDLEANNIKKYDYSDLRQKKYYPNLPDKYIGLLPYCGIDDYSLDINKYLSGRTVNNMHQYNPQTLNKLCSVLDYSLNELDKDFGKYEGIVFRIGFFDKNIPQYFSTSKTPFEKRYVDMLKKKQEMNDNNKSVGSNLQINIIKVKNGHKICDFQKHYLCPTDDDEKIYSTELNDYVDIVQEYNNEDEILLPKSSEYREGFDDEDLTAEKMKLAKNLLPYCIGNNIEGYGSIEEILDNIKIWEEIDKSEK